MFEKLRKRFKETANKKAIEDTSKGRNSGDYFISALADHENGYREGFIAGAELGYKEAIVQAKQWWKRGSVWLDLMSVKDSNDLSDIINTFETDMDKLLEEKK